MTQANETLVRQILGGLIDTHTGAPLAEAVRAVGVDGAKVSVDLQLGYPAAGAIDAMAMRVRQALEADPAIDTAAVSITSRIHVHKVQGTLGPLPNVKNIIVVASGKGGVGKSTVSANLALALQAEGAKVGVMDADIYGPSQPTMLGVHGKPASPDGKSIIPMQAHGMPVMSIGFLVEEDTPMIWRGPMVMSALTQMLREVEWGALDVLVVDMPPGTGDAQLTLAQQVPLKGAIIISTPQDLALIDARRGLAMFTRVNVPVLGIIENMSYFQCPHCGTRSDIFGHGGARHEAEKLGVPFLGEVPLHMAIRATSDSGAPLVATEPNSEHAGIYRAIAARVAEKLKPRAAGT
jgi:ATP-binding protein involved in chromosome partitioning